MTQLYLLFVHAIDATLAFLTIWVQCYHYDFNEFLGKAITIIATKMTSRSMFIVTKQMIQLAV
ncbi:MAG: hypothetical protein MJK10_18790 [Pseudomonadales bacterium]|nr:hypothetical protein [Pseudomonadales bacterium]NRA16388.1 hypothetical protein [Oceanospirillaceae bacterium]